MFKVVKTNGCSNLNESGGSSVEHAQVCVRKDLFCSVDTQKKNSISNVKKYVPEYCFLESTLNSTQVLLHFGSSAPFYWSISDLCCHAIRGHTF
jgi:hypothetical protein